MTDRAADPAPDFPTESPLRERLRQVDAEIVANRQDRVLLKFLHAAVRKEPG